MCCLRRVEQAVPLLSHVADKSEASCICTKICTTWLAWSSTLDIAGRQCNAYRRDITWLKYDLSNRHQTRMKMAHASKNKKGNFYGANVREQWRDRSIPAWLPNIC